MLASLRESTKSPQQQAPEKELFSKEPFHTTHESNKEQKEYLNIERERENTGPCRSFGYIFWKDGSRGTGADILRLTTPLDGSTENLWTNTGITSDSAGYYEFDTPTSCPLRLAAMITGKAWGEEEFSKFNKTTVTYDIRRDLVLDKAYSAFGTVLQETEYPIKEADLCLSPTDDVAGVYSADTTMLEAVEKQSRLWSVTATSNERGEFFLGALREGNWTLLVEAEGYEHGIVEFQVPDDCTRRDPCIVILNNAVCWTVLVSAYNTVIENAVVVVYPGRYSCKSQSRSAGVTSVTDKYGVAEVCDIPAKDALVVARKDNYTMERKKNTRGEVEFGISLENARCLEGTIDGFSAEECPCYLFAHQAGRMSSSGITIDVDDSGFFHTSHVPGDVNEYSVITEIGVLRSPMPEKMKSNGCFDAGLLLLEKTEKHRSNCWGILGNYSDGICE